ncbi:MAG: CDP-alcohol phosphatidyltransferase family protein [Bacteroidetes bacterium]|nr:CDP-alcohol phosphatidyltransferase family protein [Bacteroidota bacterium]
MSKKKSKSTPPQAKNAIAESEQPLGSITTPSNLLSILRALLVIPLILLFDEPRTNQLLIAGLCFFAYLTDLGDGWLARKFGGETRMGRIIDPLADKVYITVFVILTITSRMLPLWYGIAVIARDVLIFTGGIYLRARTGQVVHSNMLGKATVVSIGFVLIAALFGEGGTNITLTLLMMVSVGLLFASLYVYGERFMKLMKTQKK